MTDTHQARRTLGLARSAAILAAASLLGCGMDEYGEPEADPIGVETLALTVTQFTDTFAASDGSSCNTAATIYGREPEEPGRYPLYIHLVGTGDVADNSYALGMIDSMAAQGYVAASVDYLSLNGLWWYALVGGDACPNLQNKAECVFGPAYNTAVTKLCARAKADCDRGIIVSGHSQGSWIATLGKGHDWRVRAVYGLSEGHHPVQVLADVWVTSCLTDTNRSLPDDHLRIVAGESDEVFVDVHQEIRDISHLDCASGSMECLRPNGSGWVIFPDAANQDGRGSSGHCYVANMPGGDCASPTGLNTNWTVGTTRNYSRESNLTWLKGFTDPQSTDPLVDGLVGYWKFDETSGSTASDSDGHNNGTLAGSPTWQPGKMNGGLYSDGWWWKRVEVARDPSLSITSMTLAGWIKLGDLNAKTIISHGAGTLNNYELTTLPNGGVWFAWGSGTSSMTASNGGRFAAGRWVHVAGTYDQASQTATIYINGVLDSTVTGRPGGIPVPGAVTIGIKNDFSNAYNGTLDDVRIYNRALSASEIASMAALTCVPESNSQFLLRLGKNCGAVTAADNCGDTRSVVSGGTCNTGSTCGGGGEPNVCGSPAG